MSLTLRRSLDRGRYQNDWLDSRHTFSFGEYSDPAWMGYSDLRVLNQDLVVGGGAFGLHPHRDMEIISYVLEGALRHGDSMGQTGVLREGCAQRISAGKGMSHSEANDSETARVHFLQIWIPPRKLGAPASYESAEFPRATREAGWVALATPGGTAGSLRVDQDARIDLTRLLRGQSRVWNTTPGRRAWVHLAVGAATLNGLALVSGDGVAVEKETALEFKASQDSEILVFDLR
ncbi:MAG: pirin family protein [candidate division FCPU426 bacterium]